MHKLFLTFLFFIILSTACWADADLTQMYVHQQPTHQKMEDDSFMSGLNDPSALRPVNRNGQLSPETSLGYDAYSSGLQADAPLPTPATASYDFPQHSTSDLYDPTDLSPKSSLDDDNNPINQ